MIGDGDGVGRVLEVLRATGAGGDAGDGASGPLVFATLLPARPAEHAMLDPPLPPPLQCHLERAGIRLYRHQVDAIQAMRGGGSGVVSTPTASGKTLAFNLPVFERLATDPDATALYVYPMKALANDQLATLRALEQSTGGGAVIFIYDGYPGGIGIAEKAFEVFEQLASATLEMVRDCACEDGCPSCVYDRQCGNDNQFTDKQAALLILDRLTR
jgi:ATP-dependent helicase YprA (DUF1998 family)